MILIVITIKLFYISYFNTHKNQPKSSGVSNIKISTWIQKKIKVT